MHILEINRISLIQQNSTWIQPAHGSLKYQSFVSVPERHTGALRRSRSSRHSRQMRWKHFEHRLKLLVFLRIDLVSQSL